MNLSVENFKDGFFCLAKFCRNELLQKMISSLNKAQVDLLLKHLDQISLLSQDSTENEEGTNTDFLNLMNLYESLTIPLRLTILVEILDHLVRNPQATPVIFCHLTFFELFAHALVERRIIELDELAKYFEEKNDDTVGF